MTGDFEYLDFLNKRLSDIRRLAMYIATYLINQAINTRIINDKCVAMYIH